MKNPLFGMLALLGMLGHAAQATEQADVIVVTANPAGVAAAVAAAQSGAKVILLEESAHIGGIVAGGLTNTDIRKHGAVGGLYNEFKRQILEHYTTTYGPEARQVKVCKLGHMFEPHIAEKVFGDMPAAQKNLALLERRRVGLLVPVVCSASHVGYQTLRMEPVFMALGEASGIAAKVALDARSEVRAVDVTMVQKVIMKRGGVILYENTAIHPTGH